MSKRNRSNLDGVVAVGEVEGATFQVLQPFPDVQSFVWRIIRNEGRNVDSGMVKYPTIDEALQAVLKVLIPDAESVSFREPEEQDYEALNALLFGFGKSGGIHTFQDAVTGHSFLIHALETLKLAQAKMPHDYDAIIEAMSYNPGLDFELVQIARQLQELAAQSQQVMIDLAERDLETLSVFINEFLDL